MERVRCDPGQVVQFVCATCRTELSGPLTCVSAKDGFRIETGEPCVRKGTFVLKDTASFSGWSGDFVLHLEDARNTMHRSDGLHLDGCCGPSANGPNTCCTSEHLVGMEISDCWTEQALVLKADWVSVVPVDSSVEG